MASARSLLVVLWVIAALAFMDVAYCADPKPSDADEQFLRDHQVPTDDASLVAFLRKHSNSDDDLINLERLIEDLGSNKRIVRDEASAKLKSLGLPALRGLHKAAESSNAEVKQRAVVAIQEIDKACPWELAMAAARILCRRRAEAAAPTVLRYLPYYVADDAQADLAFAVQEILRADPQRRQVLREFLSDRVPLRRALAACLLGSLGTVAEQKQVRVLLKDASPLVRLRAAQGLLAGRDPAGVASLIELLVDPNLEIAWQAEELLSWLAGEQAPTVYIGTIAPDKRGDCRTAWLAWWRARGEKVGVAQVLSEPRRPLLVLVAECEPEPDALKRHVTLYGSNGRGRWHLDGLTWEGNGFQWLESGGILLGSSKRDLQGRVVWERKVEDDEVLRNCLSLPNGHTWELRNRQVTDYDALREPVREWKVDANRKTFPGWAKPSHGKVVTIDREGGPIEKLEVCELQADTGHELRRLPLPISAWPRLTVEVLPNRNLLIAAGNPKTGAGLRALPPMKGALGRTAIWELDSELLEVRRWLVGDVKGLRALGKSILFSGKFHYRADNGLFELGADGRLLWEHYSRLDISALALCHPLVRLGFDVYAGDLGSLDSRAKGLASPHAEVRQRSAQSIWSLGEKSAPLVATIVTALDDPDADTVEALCGALHELGSAIVPRLTKLLKHTNPVVRAEAASLFPETWPASQSQLASLLEALSDPESSVRRAAILAIRSIGKEAATKGMPRLINPLEDKDPEVRAQAIEALGSAGTQAKDAIPGLLRLANGNDWPTTKQCLHALVSIAPEQPALLAILGRLLRESRDVERRKTAVNCLGSMRSQVRSAVPLLQEALKDPDISVRALAELALRNVPPKP